MFNGTIIIPLIMAMVQLLKGLGMPKKFGALASLIIGAILGVFYIDGNGFKEGLLMGIIYGLSASGLYSGTKNTIEETRDWRENRRL